MIDLNLVAPGPIMDSILFSFAVYVHSRQIIRLIPVIRRTLTLPNFPLCQAKPYATPIGILLAIFRVRTVAIVAIDT